MTCTTLLKLGTGDASESVQRQEAHARAFAAERGWTVAEAHVYVDDLISGGEFVNRPAFVRMMAAIPEARRPPFDVLVMSDQDRLGRDMLRTAVAVRDITEAGVRIFTYLDGAEVMAETLMDQMKVMFAGFGGQFEREKARLRTIDAGNKRVAEKYVGGGKAFGYANRATAGPDEKRRKSVRVIDEQQAAVMKRVFQAVADGVGMKRICHQLMVDGVAPPARKNSKGWNAGSLRHICSTASLSTPGRS